MIKYKEETVIEEKIDTVFCDICGGSCKKDRDNEYMSLSARWGYESDHDLQSWYAEICEKCVVEKLSFIKFRKSGLTLDPEE